jgi:hypothetical protein
VTTCRDWVPKPEISQPPHHRESARNKLHAGVQRARCVSYRAGLKLGSIKPFSVPAQLKAGGRWGVSMRLGHTFLRRGPPSVAAAWAGWICPRQVALEGRSAKRCQASICQLFATSLDLRCSRNHTHPSAAIGGDRRVRRFPSECGHGGQAGGSFVGGPPETDTWLRGPSEMTPAKGPPAAASASQSGGLPRFTAGGRSVAQW